MDKLYSRNLGSGEIKALVPVATNIVQETRKHQSMAHSHLVPKVTAASIHRFDRRTCRLSWCHYILIEDQEGTCAGLGVAGRPPARSQVVHF